MVKKRGTQEKEKEGRTIKEVQIARGGKLFLKQARRHLSLPREEELLGMVLGKRQPLGEEALEGKLLCQLSQGESPFRQHLGKHLRKRRIQAADRKVKISPLKREGEGKGVPPPPRLVWEKR